MDIMTKEAFMNALTMDMALGCSTNSMLHLPAIAHEAGVELNVDIANEISAKTPNPVSYTHLHGRGSHPGASLGHDIPCPVPVRKRGLYGCLNGVRFLIQVKGIS